MYVFLKVFHILFVIGWMSCLFVLPRAILFWKYAHESGESCEHLRQLCFRLFRFGSLMGVLAIALGVWLWLAFDFKGHWLMVKMVLVALLVVYYFVCGGLVYQAISQSRFKSSFFLRAFNESAVLLVIVILYAVVSKWP